MAIILYSISANSIGSRMKDQCWHQESQYSIVHGRPLTLYVFGEVLDSWVAFYPLCEWNRNRRLDWNLSLSGNSALVAMNPAERPSPA